MPLLMQSSRCINPAHLAPQVESYLEAKGRYIVLLSSGETVALKPANLTSAAEAEEKDSKQADISELD